VIITLVTNYPTHLFAVLLGLTFPTMAIVYKQMNRPATREWAIAGLTAAGFLALFVAAGETINVTQPHPLHLFFGGMLAVSTMVLPGVSGSFMLLVLGLYNFVIGLVASLSEGSVDMRTLTSVGILMAGMATGFLTTVRLLKKAFSSYRNQLMAFLLGLLISSWYVLWPFVQVVGFDHDAPILKKVSPLNLELSQVVLVILLVTVTAAATSWLHNWADKHDQTSSKQDQGFDKL
jgi:putative membrane protein